MQVSHHSFVLFSFLVHSLLGHSKFRAWSGWVTRRVGVVWWDAFLSHLPSLWRLSRIACACAAVASLFAQKSCVPLRRLEIPRLVDLCFPMSVLLVIWTRKSEFGCKNHEMYNDFKTYIYLLDRGFEKCTSGFGEKLSQSEQHFAFMCWNKCNFRPSCHSRLGRTLKCLSGTAAANARQWRGLI